MKARSEREIIIHLHLQIDGRIFRKVAHIALHFGRFFENIETRDNGLTGSGGHETCENFHRRGLARAIRPKETDDLAFLNFKTEIVYGRARAIHFCEVIDLDHELYLDRTWADVKISACFC